jgi:hypothetical protein
MLDGGVLPPGLTLVTATYTGRPAVVAVVAVEVFESTRWLRHQHTDDSGFLGPSMVATSSYRARVAGLTSMVTEPR